ncbi:MAG: uroporphyrinogen decarboxylase family protein [Kiritimatiellia bacterium]|nr:uroporphyrinogen decarboxylase family protein [Kiritimatiellia bacterium]
MSLKDGWSAIHLEMPARVPRTEYSAHNHWSLVRAVTGQLVSPASPEPDRERAAEAFVRAWNYDYMWSILISRDEMGSLRTDMGHAEYEEGGADRRAANACPFASPEEALCFDPRAAYGAPDRAALRRRFEEHYRDQCPKYPEAANSTGIYITLVSGLIEIFGWDMMLMALGTDPEGFGALMDRYALWIQDYFETLAETDVPVVMIHDDIVWTSGPFCHPDWYRRYVFPHYHRFFRPLLDAGKRLLFTSDGTYTLFADDIAAAGVHGFVMEPTTDLEWMAPKYGQTHVLIGNADTRILLSGTKEQIRSEVERCMRAGKSCTGFFMAVGNHIPANTPVDNAIYYNEVYEELSRR